MKKFYDQSFYDSQKQGSFSSAELYLAYLWVFYSPASIVDLGCGAGTWLKAAGNLGATTLVGYDGEWNSQENMVDQNILFKPADLNKPIVTDRKFDLAMSLEVAEHLDPGSSESFVESLTSFSDVVLFGAAYIGQGGTNHINERMHSEWAVMFQKQGYAVFDLFRPVFWGEPAVDTCYAQNAFLYVKKTHSLYKQLLDSGLKELSNFAFMNCVHPVLYDAARKKGRSLREKLARKPPQEILISLLKEFKRFSTRVGNALSK